MSKFQKPSLYSGRALDNQWMNNIFNSHDLFCGCLDPIKHLRDILKQQRCPSSKTTTKDGTPDGDDFIIDAGELETLFATEENAKG